MISAAPREADPKPTYEVGAAVFTRPAAHGGLSLFAPLHYEPGYAYPLIVWLHGAGNNENQLRRLMPLVSVRNYVAVAPRGTVPMRDGAVRMPGYTWMQAGEHIQAAEQRVFEAVETARGRFNINPQRVFLAGIGQGGTMAFRIALQHPRSFAGVVSMGGPFPTDQAPLRQLLAARSLPVLIGCGRTSDAYPSPSVCDDLRLLHSAGLSLTIREYPCGDEVDPNMLRDLDRWIMEQIVPSGPINDEAFESNADTAN
jgi:phospholipase/carboxylesterase